MSIFVCPVFFISILGGFKALNPFGAFECWPRHKKLFSPGSIRACYGKAISAEQAKNMGDKKLAELLTDILRQMQTKSRVKQGKKTV